MIRHARAMLEEIGKPSGLHDPDEGNMEHAAANRNRRIRPRNDSNGSEPLENGDFVLDALIISASVKAGANFSPRSTLSDMLDLLWREARLHARQGKAVILNQRLEVAAIGDEVTFKDLAAQRIACNSLGNLQHSARLRQVEGTRSEEESFLGHGPALSHRSHRNARSTNGFAPFSMQTP